MRFPTRFISNTLLCSATLALFLAFVPAASARPAQQKEEKGKDVYVCACGKDKSCPCMAMSNKEGKCPCGHDDLKAVARDSDWAKNNRKKLM